MTVKCNLCLFECPPSSVENDDLRRLVDKIFYFKIFRGQGDQTLICNACKATVEEFYKYAENVWKNQQFLRESFDASPSISFNNAQLDPQSQNVAKKVKIEKQELPDGEEEEKDELDVFEAKIFLETSIEEVNETEDGIDDKANPERNPPEDAANDITDSENDAYEPEGADSESAVEDDEEEFKPKKKKKSYYTKKPKVPKAPKPPKPEKEKKAVDSQKAALEAELLQHFKLDCDICAIPMNDFNELGKHFKRLHREEQVYIRCCNKKIQRKYWIVEHLQVHLYPNAFHCEICNKSYTSSRVLKEHHKEVHTPNEARAVKCETCQKSFATQRALSSHLLASHGSVPCPQCFKVLASQGSLKKHMLMMHGEGEQYVCDTCARVFRSKPCFEKHIKVHLGTAEVDRVQCTLCPAWLTDKNCLQKHMKRCHTGEEEVVNCEECGRPQRNKIMLKAHMIRSHGESRFECEICFKKFKRSYHMREHKAIHHTGEDLYGCDYCPERFNNKNKQCLHRKMCHPVEYEEEQRRRTGGGGTGPIFSFPASFPPPSFENMPMPPV